jgi:hypothetical protein
MPNRFSIDHYEDDQPPANPFRPAAEIGENAEDGEEARMNTELTPRENRSGKSNKLVGAWHKEQDGETNPVGDVKDDGDSHGSGFRLVIMGRKNGLDDAIIS